MFYRSVMQLFPLPAAERPLTGLYLGHQLRQLARPTGRAFVYSNYITSLDGRIAVPHPEKPGLTVPQQVANDHDWRLFQELAAQADVIITSGRYLRDYADGRAQEILQVADDPRFADLLAWRLDHGLPPLPDLAVISGSLDFPVPAALTEGQRRVVVFTVESADKTRRVALEKQTGQVFVAGAESVQGTLLVSKLTELGYQTVYNATGPKVLHLLLADDVLDRLYLTYAHRILGGDPFATMVDGPLLTPPIGMILQALYLDPHGLEGAGQLFTTYQRLQPAL